MYYYGPPHMAVQKQDDQHEHTFSNYERIQDVVQKTSLRRWTIGKSGERGSGISVLPARHDDDDFKAKKCVFYCCRDLCNKIFDNSNVSPFRCFIFQMFNDISVWSVSHWKDNNYKNSYISEGSRVFANGPGDLGSIQGRVIPKTLKMALDTSLLNTQQYKVRIKDKVEQSRERSSALPYTSV